MTTYTSMVEQANPDVRNRVRNVMTELNDTGVPQVRKCCVDW
jgi:hypothetical protein